MNRFKLVLFSLTLFLLGGITEGTAQDYTTKKTVSGKLKKIWDKGMQYNLKGENMKAIKEFQKALKIDASFIDAQLQLAALNYEMKRFDLGELGFEKVLAIDPNYNKKVFYTLGLAELKQNKYAEAAEHFNDYLNSGAKNKSLLAKSQRLYKNCKFIGEALANPVPFDPESLGKNINTANSEYLPSLTADGETLVYTVRERNDENFYISTKPSISSDKNALYFCSNRANGKGESDIWVSYRQAGGKWGTPENLGEMINTPKKEQSPFIHPDGQTLYFMSNGHPGMGGFDLYFSRKQEDGSWGEPQNIGNKNIYSILKTSP